MQKHSREPRLFKVNKGLPEDSSKLQWADENINTMMQQLFAAWNPHLQLEADNDIDIIILQIDTIKNRIINVQRKSKMA
jgi:hypothetical protein